MTSDVLQNKNIVLIEDDNFLASVIVQKLAEVGSNIKRYKNGKDGLEAIRKEMPDLILLDIAMPVMDGYEVLEVMSQEGLIAKIPVIVISNSGQPVEIQRVVDYGVKDYLVKVDLTPEEIFTRARLVLASNQYATSPTTAGIDAQKVPDTDANALKVLVIEDDQLLRNLLSVKLTKNGCTPMYVADGSKAIELTKSFGPDAILLDLMLPGMDGFEILTELKKDEALKDIPVMVFSNKGERENEERAMSLGASTYMVKAHTDLNNVIKELHTLTGK